MDKRSYSDAGTRISAWTWYDFVGGLVVVLSGERKRSAVSTCPTAIDRPSCSGQRQVISYREREGISVHDYDSEMSV